LFRHRSLSSIERDKLSGSEDGGGGGVEYNLTMMAESK
jgi:hypothetical protein